MPGLQLETPVYRYFTTDLLSNTLLAEIPFRGVSFERAIKGAGSFSGSIPIIPGTDSMSLYESTAPGKTAVYVTRDGVCVWGGIIWSRNYNLTSRTMSVSASEFTSYFHHRRIWKTWTHDYGVTLTVNNQIGLVTFDAGYTYTAVPNSSVKISFREVNNFQYDGYYTVLASPAPTPTSLTIDAVGVPNGTYPLTTMLIRTDTYDWVRQLIDGVLKDFTGYEFPNDEIEPGIGTQFVVTNKQLLSGFATLTTAEDHDITPGQVVIVRNVDSAFNGQYIVTDTPNARQIKYAKSGSVNSTPVSILTRTVTNKQLTDYVATLTTSVPHGFSVGQRVEITGVDAADSISEILNGTFIITSVTSNTFSYLTGGVKNIPLSPSTGGTAKVTPHVLSGSYGPYSSNSDIDIEFSTYEYSGVDLDPPSYRGFELRNVGVELDRYSDLLPVKKRKRRTLPTALDRLNGFEYRVDCEYDPNTASFKRIFVLMPINFPDPPAAGEVSPISRFGADQLVFEYPGNISDLQIDEKADQSATRFWLQGNLGDLGADASQPYAAAADKDLLSQGWPLLDEEHSEQDVSDEQTLYEYAKRYLSETRPPTADISVTVNGSLAPVVGDYVPGDWCSLVLDDPFILMRLASDLEPRSTAIVRKIDSFTVTVPDAPAFPEKVTLKLIAEWQVDTKGTVA